MSPDRLVRSYPRHFRSKHEFIESFKQNLRSRFFVSDLNNKEFYVSLMTSLGGFDTIMDDADMVHENKLQTLGSDVFSFGEKMDWHLDFKSGKRWRVAYYTNINIIERGESRQEEGDSPPEKSVKRGTANTGPATPHFEHSDVKVPWEVNRFHQAIWLGKAYWISHSEAHTDKFKELVNDWIENNPVGYGINWHTPMEVAIRAMNLIVGLLYFMGSSRLDDEFILSLLCSLFEHGIFIRYNLERRFRNHNHLISDLAGLLFLGILFYDTKAGKRWVKLARKELEAEITNQVCPDGTDYEKSTSYQRLVMELFTVSYRLLSLNGFEVSHTLRERLENMYTFLASATMQSGHVPNIGDADDGRVFRIKANIDFNDHRDLLSVGAALFNRPDLKAAAGSYSELALLLLGGEGFEKFTMLERQHEVSSSLFSQGGFAFLKSERDFCSFDFGDIGQRGRGGHGHNDVLSVTISGKDKLLVDRGTYCYTSDPIIRNKLRSTYSHNTVVIDKIEQAEFAGLWTIKEDLTSPELVGWKSSSEQDVIEALHHGYSRQPQPVVHKRKITFNKKQRTFIIEDDLSGEGQHVVELMFHFAPELKVVDLGRNFIGLEGNEFALMKFDRSFMIENWEHSQSYGVIQRAKTARVTIESHLPLRVQTFLFIISSADEMNRLLNRIQ